MFVNAKNGACGNASIDVGGTIEGITCFEVAGSSNRLDQVIGGNYTTASLTSLATPALTVNGAGALILGCIGTVSATGTISAWTGTPTLNNVTTATARTVGGYAVNTSIVSAQQFTAHWGTSTTGAMAMVATLVPGGSFMGLL